MQPAVSCEFRSKICLDTVWYSEFWHLATEWISRLLLNMTLRMVEAAAAVKARDLMTDDGDWITGANNRLLADDWVEGVTRWHGLGGSSENPCRHGWTIQNCLLIYVSHCSSKWGLNGSLWYSSMWNMKQEVSFAVALLVAAFSFDQHPGSTPTPAFPYRNQDLKCSWRLSAALLCFVICGEWFHWQKDKDDKTMENKQALPLQRRVCFENLMTMQLNFVYNLCECV